MVNMKKTIVVEGWPWLQSGVFAVQGYSAEQNSETHTLFSDEAGE